MLDSGKKAACVIHFSPGSHSISLLNNKNKEREREHISTTVAACSETTWQRSGMGGNQ